MIIRRFEDKDCNAVIDLTQRFHAESLKEYGSVIDVKFLIKLFHEVKETSFLVEEEKKVTGLLAGKVVTDLLSEEKTYAEIMWFMRKEKRQHGIRLLRFVEKWVRDQGIKRMMMVHMGNSKSDKLSDFYRRIGYIPMEIHYIKQL